MKERRSLAHEASYFPQAFLSLFRGHCMLVVHEHHSQLACGKTSNNALSEPLNLPHGYVRACVSVCMPYQATAETLPGTARTTRQWIHVPSSSRAASTSFAVATSPMSANSAARTRPAPRLSLLPMPEFIRKLFTSFPLHEWPSAQAGTAEPELEKVSEKPTLYVATKWPGQWASADPVCLRWQMELLLRGADFDVVALDDVYWAPEGNAPFLQLAPSQRASMEGTERLPGLVGMAGIPHFVENHYPLDRPELEEKSVWPSEEVKHESIAWRTLLYGRLTAGALLLALQSNVFAPKEASEPLLRSVLAPLMPGEATLEQRELGRVVQLASAGASYQSVNAVFGSDSLADQRNPLSVVPGYTVDFVGVFSGTSQQNAQDEDLEEPPLSLQINQDAILEQATHALHACAARLDADLKHNPDAWMLGASRATSLDCLLFAAVHTILMTPHDSLGANSSLRLAVDRHPSLVSYIERLRKKLPQ